MKCDFISHQILTGLTAGTVSRNQGAHREMGSERRSRQNPVAMNKKRIVGSGVGRACWRWRSPMRYGHQAVDPTPRPSQVWYHGRKESHPYLGRPGHLPKGNRTSRYAKMFRGCPGVSRGIVDQSLERLWSKVERPPRTVTLEEAWHAETADNIGQLPLRR